MFKKITTTFLTIAFMLMSASPLCVGVSANNERNAKQDVQANSEELTLKEFLETTEDISASYKYPSMKLSSDEEEGKSVLPAHTPIVIRCKETITTNNIVNGSTVKFSVLKDVKDSKGNILIKSGTLVTAQISFVKDKGMVGKSGELTISDFHTTAVDRSYIPLSGTVSAKPDDKMVTSVVLSVLICPLFLLMKGDEAQLNAGATKTAYTVVKTYINTGTY